MTTLKKEIPDTIPLKIRESLNYLENSNLNVSEIAYYFSKTFKKTFGCTPSDFTKKINDNEFYTYFAI